MIVLAWWTRLLYVDEDEARGRAAELLGSVVFASARSPLNFPASELFHSCRFVRLLSLSLSMLCPHSLGPNTP
jgi:hypothetical protein